MISTDKTNKYIAKNHPQALNTLIKSAPKNFDLTSKLHYGKLTTATEIILALFDTRAALDALEKELIAVKDDIPILIHLAVKLAISKRIIISLQETLHISIVFAVYKEHNRIKTSEEHEHGENFLIRKIAQLEWLFNSCPNFSWDLIIVDGGCPENSGKIAQEILTANNLGSNVQVLFVEDAIRQRLPVTAPMTSIVESKKGGAIEYGMWVAAQQEKPNHIILFTDADLSTHLGQIGLLLEGIANQNQDAAIGSRRGKKAVVGKPTYRYRRAKLFSYLRGQLTPNINHIEDTQCGFKAFRANIVRAIICDMIDKGFAFDIELLLKTELNRKNSIAQVPIVWIDSDAASTITDQQPYLTMLKSVAKMYQKYLPQNPESDTFAQFIESLNEEMWLKLIDNVPSTIVELGLAEFDNHNRVKVADLQAALA